jgi:hypothetical protein
MKQSCKMLVAMSLAVATTMVGCAGNPNGGSSNNGNTSGLSPVGVYDSEHGIVKARAIMDVSSGSEDAQAFLSLKPMEKFAALFMPTSRASGGTCTHGSCIDYVDVTVVNTASTTFQLDNTFLVAPACTAELTQVTCQAIAGCAWGTGCTGTPTTTFDWVSSNTPVSFGNLKVKTLYDNNLMACAAACSTYVATGTCTGAGCSWAGSTCSGTPTPVKCGHAFINIYTDNNNTLGLASKPAVIGSGATITSYNVSGLVNTAKSIASAAVSVPIILSESGSAVGTVPDAYITNGRTSLPAESLTLAAATQVIDQSYLPIGGEAASNTGVSQAAPTGTGYVLNANFTQASQGTYQARIVLEYVLAQ